ncbi:MAG: hypothetical protein M3Y54_10070 [Bacteroidota bacterium]|nr:hypothetical protein [Bacteroidota bacterium]
MHRLNYHLLVAAFGWLILSSCQSKTEATRTETAAAAVAPDTAATLAAAAPSLARRFGPIISGGWMITSYLRVLRRTHSPQIAADSISADVPVSLFIAPAAVAADSTLMQLNYNMHEGDEASIYFRTGRQPNSLPLRSHSETGKRYEISYRISAADTALFLLEYSMRGKLIRQNRYQKTLVASAQGTESNQAFHQAVDYPLNKILVAGKYEGTDSLGHRVQVTFSPTGYVSGIPFRKYHVMEDFIGPVIGDEIIFDMYTKHQHELAAVFRPDTLRLYTVLSATEAAKDTTLSDSILVFRRGILRYQLVRKR